MKKRILSNGQFTKGIKYNFNNNNKKKKQSSIYLIQLINLDCIGKFNILCNNKKRR